MLYFFSTKSSIVFICQVDLWTISKAKSSVRKSTRAVFGRIYFPLLSGTKISNIRKVPFATKTLFRLKVLLIKSLKSKYFYVIITVKS